MEKYKNGTKWNKKLLHIKRVVCVCMLMLLRSCIWSNCKALTFIIKWWCRGIQRELKCLFFSFVHHTDPSVRTDRRTDRILIARPRLHSIQRGKNK